MEKENSSHINSNCQIPTAEGGSQEGNLSRGSRCPCIHWLAFYTTNEKGIHCADHVHRFDSIIMMKYKYS